jgi:hypothetical protein
MRATNRDRRDGLLRARTQSLPFSFLQDYNTRESFDADLVRIHLVDFIDFLLP